MTIDPNQRHLCLFPEQLTDAQDWRTIGDLLPSYYSKVHQPTKSIQGTWQNYLFAIWITAMITSLPGSHTLPCRSVPKRLGINVFEMYFPVKYNQRKQQEINCLWHWQHILHWNWIKWINGIKWQQGREATKLWHLQLCIIIVTH